jgi:hypothetical protein
MRPTTAASATFLRPPPTQSNCAPSPAMPRIPRDHRGAPIVEMQLMRPKGPSHIHTARHDEGLLGDVHLAEPAHTTGTGEEACPRCRASTAPPHPARASLWSSLATLSREGRGNSSPAACRPSAARAVRPHLARRKRGSPPSARARALTQLSNGPRLRAHTQLSSGDQAGSEAKLGVCTRCSLRPVTSMVNSDGPLPGSRKNISTRPFGAKVGPSLW